jgi:hypothetical protein
MRPTPTDYPEYFGKYIALVKEDDVMQAFANQQSVIASELSKISEERSMFSYAPGKWTLKEMLQHIIDAERVFEYRALAFSRKEANPLPSFDEDSYAANSNANSRSWASLVSEFEHVRSATLDLFQSFTPAMLSQSGIASGKSVTVLSLGYISVGHVYHHLQVVKERYLVKK